MDTAISIIFFVVGVYAVSYLFEVVTKGKYVSVHEGNEILFLCIFLPLISILILIQFNNFHLMSWSYLIGFTIVSSIAGYRGLPNSTGYGPSKSALNNLAESLYFDFKRSNVRVCLVSPGFIKTPMTDKNDFKMPFLKTTEYAAEKIYDGLINKNVFEIHFPKSLTLILKILSFLPNKIYFGLIGKMTKYQKKD